MLLICVETRSVSNGYTSAKRDSTKMTFPTFIGVSFSNYP